MGAAAMNKYQAGLNGRTIELEAASLWAAKQAAIEALKPRKKDAGLLWVILCEKDGEAVTHDPGALV
jgi:hypothetical protein